VGRIARVTSEVTGEDPRRVARRLEASRGMIARELPRIQAERIQRELHMHGIPAARVALTRANRPPVPLPAEAVSWDNRLLRVHAAPEVFDVPWPVPFLYAAARVRHVPRVDVFVNRRAAFRITPATILTRVDAGRRREERADLNGFAADVLEYRSGAVLNEGVRVLAHRGTWGWLDFHDAADYDDYLFWIYTLIVSQVPIQRI
jgi:hypothetical protein